MRGNDFEHLMNTSEYTSSRKCRVLRRIQETLGRIAQGRQTLEEDKMRPDTVAERNAKLAMVTK